MTPEEKEATKVKGRALLTEALRLMDIAEIRNFVVERCEVVEQEDPPGKFYDWKERNKTFPTRELKGLISQNLDSALDQDDIHTLEIFIRHLLVPDTANPE